MKNVFKRKKIICDLFIFIFSFFPLTVNAATLNGQAYGAYFVEGRDVNNDIVQTSDGGAAMISFSSSYAWSSPPANFEDERDSKALSRMFLVKTDSSGTEQWRRVVGPEGYNITRKQIGSDVHWSGTGIIQTGTDDLVVAGYKGTTASGTGIDVVLMKFSDSGDLIWERSFNSQFNNNDISGRVIKRSGGGLAIATYASGFAGVILTDINGENDVKRYYNANGKGWIQIRDIIETSDGGLAISGWTSTGAATDEDYYIVKTSADGTLEWAQRYDNASRRDKAMSIEEDGLGNLWAFGRSSVAGIENTHIWAVKVDMHNGNLLNSYTISGDNNNANAYIGKDSIKLANGNFLVIGYTNVSGGHGYDGYVVEVDTSGQIVGSPKIVGADTAYNEDYLFSGIISQDGQSYLLAGTNNGAFSTGYDLWFLKLAVSDKSVQNFTLCPVKAMYYYDKDLDGFGNNNFWSDPTATICQQMPGYVVNHSDCDDQNFGVGDCNSVAPSIPNGLSVR